jgi:Carboxypeptidase regulatory-like domain
MTQISITIRRIVHAVSKRSVLAIAFCVGLVTVPATDAQILYGTLTGTVRDTSGATVPNAKVETLETSQGAIRIANTDSDGTYRITDLVPGNYKITVSAPNFASYITDNLLIDANTVQRLDAKLGAGTVTQTVEVNTAPALLQTERSDVQAQLTITQLQNIPAISSEGKNFQALYKLVPGATMPTENNSAAGNPQRAMTSNVNGQSSQGNNTSIDGVINSYPWLPNNVAYVPATDAIESVNVVTSSFDAEQGQVGGAAINVQTKSGTNQFHGDAHEYHTDNALKNFNYFNPPGFHKALNVFNQYGAAVGGPIRKDKLFFFANWESTRQVQSPSGGNPQTVPTGGLVAATAVTNGFFDFRGLQVDKSGAPVHIYDPRTGNANGTNRSPISCNGVVDEICLSQVDPAALTMLKLVPAPNQTGTTNNFLDTQKGFFNRNDIDGKVNWVSNKTQMFGRYSYSGSQIFDPPAFSAAGGNSTLGGQQGNAFGRVQVVGIGATHTFTPNLLLDLNGGFTRQRLNAENVDIAADKDYGLSVLKIPGTNNSQDPNNQLYWGQPAFTWGTGYSPLGNPNNANPFLFRDMQYVGAANLSWVKGRHSFRGGLLYTHSMLNHFQPQGTNAPRGTFTFSGAGEEQVTCTATACSSTDAPTTLQFAGYAGFLLGLPETLGKTIQIVDPIALRWSQWAWYLRDNYSINPKLNINYGVRWEYYPMAYSDHGGARVLDPSTMNVLIGGNGSVPIDDGVNTGHGQFLPRFGFAYRPTGNMVIRGGYGMNADSNNWRFLRNCYPADTQSTFTGNSYTPPGISSFAPAGSLTGLNAVGSYSYLPTGITLIPNANTSTGILPLPNNTGTTTIPLNFRRGYIHSYNLTVEQNINNFVFTAAYVGARAIRPLTNMNINPAPAGGGTAGRVLNAAHGGTWSDINQLTPYGNNYYDALQSKLTRRFSNGSVAGLIYTWSKTINFEDNEEINSVLRPYPAYLLYNKAAAGFDRTNNFQAYFVYQLPFGKGQKWATEGIASALAGGWRVGGVVSALTGIPFTVTDSNGNTVNAPGNTQTPNIIAPIRILKGRPNPIPGNCADDSCKYFNVEAFQHVTTPGVFGNAGRDIIRGPGFFDMDMSLYRTFRIMERLHFEFEMNVIGVTNTPHFGNPTADINNSNFGKITGSLATTNTSLGGSGGEREFLFGGKLVF